MAFTDIEILKMQVAGALNASPATAAVEAVRQAYSRSYTFDKAAADAMASTATAETFTGRYVKHKSKLRGVVASPVSGGLTADNTNFATITVTMRDSAGANPVNVATLTTTITSSGNLTQGAGKALLGPAAAAFAEVVIPAGSTFTYTITKAGTGVVVPAMGFDLDLERV